MAETNPDDVIRQPQGTDGLWIFWCPACSCGHPYHVPQWTWNGSTTRPTFTPSLLVFPSVKQPRCHLFVTNGEIRYCEDSEHELRGKTVPMIPWDRLYDEWKVVQ